MKAITALKEFCGTYSSEDDLLYIWENHGTYFFMFNGIILKSAKTFGTAQKYLKEFVKKYNLVKYVDE